MMVHPACGDPEILPSVLERAGFRCRMVTRDLQTARLRSGGQSGYLYAGRQYARIHIRCTRRDTAALDSVKGDAGSAATAD